MNDSTKSQPHPGERIETGPLLLVEGLETSFTNEFGTVRAVRHVSFSVARGETLALVGESGSGKSVTSLSIMRLLPEPTGRIVSGSVRLRCKDGAVRDLVALDEGDLRHIRGRDAAMIFQEPMTSLNPVHKIGDQIAEAILLHEATSRRDALRRARDLMVKVEIPDAAQRMQSYPHQISGGMRQRVMIAMALACDPALLIADEPTTALDVTVQAQVLALMGRLQQELGMGILFITHNLGVVAEIATRVAVMYAGYIVEEGTAMDIFHAPSHPYTIGLLNSLPQAKPKGVRARLQSIPGNVPGPRDLPPGCPFATRCSYRIEACDERVPEFVETGAGHFSRCIRWREIRP